MNVLNSGYDYRVPLSIVTRIIIKVWIQWLLFLHAKIRDDMQTDGVIQRLKKPCSKKVQSFWGSSR